MKKTFTLFIALLIAGFIQAQTTHNITVQSNSFTPNNLTIEVGDEVVWTNIGGNHNVNGTLATFPSNPEGFGNSVGAGWTFSHTFTLSGTYDYRCDPHFSSGMTGVITVNAVASDTCTTFLGGPWTDFNSTFGGAPSASAPGECPLNEITAFEVWASESYTVDGFMNGEMYTFSMCGGSYGAWAAELSVWDENGDVVAFLSDTCSISWTATYDGTYIIGINEVGACGETSTNINVDNGFPSLTCEGLIVGSDTCDTFLGGPWNDFNTAFGGAPVAVDGVCPFNEITDFEVWASESYTVDGFVNGETYTFSMCGGSYGAWAAELSVWDENGDMIALLSDTCSISWTATYDGIYVIGINEVGACGAESTNTNTDNGFPALTCEGASAVEDITLTEFAIYPNPNEGQFSIVNRGVNANYIIELIDMTGKVVYSVQRQINSNDLVQINSTDLNSGIYLVKMTNTDENYQRTLRMLIK